MMKREPASEHPWSVPLALHEVPETGRHLELAADGQALRRHRRACRIARVAPPARGFRRHPPRRRRLAGDRAGLGAGRTDLRRHARADRERDRRADRPLFAPPSGALAHHPANREPIRRRKSDRAGKAATPAGATPGAGDAGTGGEADDARQTLIGGVVDLGALATEFLMLGIDPYPRKPDAVFEGASAGEPAANPFAALAALKKGPGGKQG